MILQGAIVDRPLQNVWAMRRIGTLSLLVSTALVGCAGEPADPCALAAERLSECYDEETASAYVCEPESAEAIAETSCAELSDIESKSDTTLCSALGLFCPADPIFPSPSGGAAQYPIVLAHGFNGSPENEWGVNPIIIDALRADGHAVHVARVSPFQSVEHRGQELADQIDIALAENNAEYVNIIAHSMGGLDSRYAISALGYEDRVRSLVTISTPHHGSLVADAALGLIPEFADSAVNAIVRAFAGTFTEEDLAENSDLRSAFESLAESSAHEFNRDVPNSEQVYYQSWAGLSNAARISNSKDVVACTADGGEMFFSDDKRDFMDLRLLPMAAIVAHGTALLPNDGMATVESSRWGEFRGCIPADHYDEIGQVNDDEINKHTGFDATAFFRTIAYDLAARGF